MSLTERTASSKLVWLLLSTVSLQSSNSAPIGWRLLAQEINAEVDGVKNGRARVTLLKLGDCLRRPIGISREVLREARLAIKTNHSNAMRHIANDGIQRRSKVAIVAQMKSALTPSLHDDSQSEGLRVSVELYLQGLRNPVVTKDEIIGGEREDNLPGLGFHQNWHEHQIRARRESRDLRAR